MKRNLNGLCLLALVLSGVGLLLIFEVMRPFRDLAIDGPLALTSWTVGSAIALTCLFRKGRSLPFSVFAVAANLLPLLASLILIWAMSRTNFAWH